MIFLARMNSTGRILYPPEYLRRTYVVNTQGKKALTSLIALNNLLRVGYHWRRISTAKNEQMS